MEKAMIRICAGAMFLAMLALPVWGDVKVEKVAYMNQPNCYRLSNGTVELIVTTDIGPRILRYGFVGGENILGEVPDLVVHTALGDWKPWGGHRLWHAPEAMPRSYSPDNSPIEFKQEGDDTVRLTEPVEPATGIQKEMVVTLSPTGTEVTIVHRIINKGLWAVEAAPWALTIMHGGGETIIPQEPYISHDDYLLPARALVLWHYSDLSDPRFTIGKRYIRLKTVTSMKDPNKVGIMNKQGWAGYLRNHVLFIKRFPFVQGATYPDYGCNNETYTAGDFMELETLGPIQRIEPNEAAEHTEHWFLFNNVDAGATEATLDAAITPLVKQTLPANAPAPPK